MEDQEIGAGAEVYLYEYDDSLPINNRTQRTYISEEPELALQKVLEVFEGALRDFGYSMENRKLVLEDKEGIDNEVLEAMRLGKRMY